MNALKHSRFFLIWRWTLGMFSLALVSCFWILPFTDSIWGTKFRYQYLFDGSLPAIGLLFITAIICGEAHRRHSILGFIICFAWLVWAVLPRF